MSIQEKIIKQLSHGPQRLKDLKTRIGNDKKVAHTLETLVKQKKVLYRNGLYISAKGDKNSKGGEECRIVKITGSFGFAQPVGAVDPSQDIFIPGRFLMGAMPGDTVLVQAAPSKTHPNSRDGRVLCIETPQDELVGLVVKQNGKLCLAPDACPKVLLPIKKSADGGALEGEKVAAVLLQRGSDYPEHRVGISMRFGDAEQASHCAQGILYANGIRKPFPEKVKLEAGKAGAMPLNPNEITKREDLRAIPIFTIDGPDTKDIDDAVSVEQTADGYLLGVHIADVSYYVRAGSALDKEAMARGTSVYYADNVVPMLPKQLSNGICSLNPGEDRFAFSCLVRLNKDGEAQSFRFCKSVIRSRVQGVYGEINRLLDGEKNTELQNKYHAVAAQIPLLREVYGKLLANHKSRGYIEIESGEAKLITDKNGFCVDIIKRQRGESERIIEELMLLANTCAAKYAARHELPFIYRVHEQPPAQKVENLCAALDAAGVEYHFAKETPASAELAQLLEKTRGTPREAFVHTTVLRSMAKAQYEPQAKGHFGLALRDYTHFTSPIRRYPDLAIHRILSDSISGMTKADLQRKYERFVQTASLQSSERELAALQAERDAEDCYKAEYMRQNIGKAFTGTIAGVTAMGVYVQLPNTVEGLLPAEALSPRPLALTQGGMALSDAVSGQSWRLGDEMQVVVAAVNVPLGRIDFALPDEAK